MALRIRLTGFPKSLDVSKALDRAAGAEREVVGPGRYAGRESPTDLGLINDDSWQGGQSRIDTAPATEAAHQWQGWGTALKPAHEPIVLARKPLTGTVASNVTRHGTGALNVDGCRVEAARGDYEHPGNNNRSGPRLKYNDYAENGRQVEPHDLGRWPSNVLLDETAAELLDEQSGVLVNCGGPKVTTHSGGMFGIGQPGAIYGDSGGASRFFYTAKASRAERNAGLEGFAERELTSYSGPESRVGRVRSDGAVQNAAKTVKQNHHPTVKPIDLMRWLCRLITPPGGHVLDPFTGSGTTGIACALEGFSFTGIEREAEYADIAEARIAYWTEHGEKALLAMYEAERRRVVAESGQMAMTV